MLNTHSRNKRLADQHPEDICEGDRLSCGLLAPKGMDVVSDVIGKKQFKRVTADTIHQLTVDLLRARDGELWVGVQCGHVPEERNEKC